MCVSVSSRSPKAYDFSNPCVLDTGTTENLPEKAPEYASGTRNGEFSVFLKMRKLLAINPEEWAIKKPNVVFVRRRNKKMVERFAEFQENSPSA